MNTKYPTKKARDLTPGDKVPTSDGAMAYEVIENRGRVGVGESIELYIRWNDRGYGYRYFEPDSDVPLLLGEDRLG